MTDWRSFWLHTLIAFGASVAFGGLMAVGAVALRGSAALAFFLCSAVMLAGTLPKPAIDAWVERTVRTNPHPKPENAAYEARLLFRSILLFWSVEASVVSFLLCVSVGLAGGGWRLAVAAPGAFLVLSLVIAADTARKKSRAFAEAIREGVVLQRLLYED